MWQAETGPRYIPAVMLASVKLPVESAWALFPPPCASPHPFLSMQKGRCYLKHLHLFLCTFTFTCKRTGEGRNRKAGVRGPLRITPQMPKGVQTPGWAVLHYAPGLCHGEGWVYKRQLGHGQPFSNVGAWALYKVTWMHAVLRPDPMMASRRVWWQNNNNNNNQERCC